MKKKLCLKSIVIMLLVAVLTLSLTACRKPTDFEKFDETFGELGRNQLDDGIAEKIILEGENKDTLYNAIDKINKNYKNFEYVAVRGKVEGDTTGTKETKQVIYSTTIKEYNRLGKSTKIFHEDASVSDSVFIKPSIVQMMQQMDAKGNANIIVRTAKDNNVDSFKMNYPKMKKIDENGLDTFDSEQKYLNKYHQDLKAVVPYVLDINTIDINSSKIEKRADGYIELDINVLKEKLQIATSEKRETIIIKTKYSIDEKELNKDSVTYEKLNVKIVLWPNSYIRSIHTDEIYKLDSMGGQTCTLHSDYYFSNDPTELPMSNFEFKK